MTTTNVNLRATRRDPEQTTWNQSPQIEIIWWRRGAWINFALGVSAIVIGMLLATTAPLLHFDNAAFDQELIGTKLTLAATPCLLLWMFCLNKLEILSETASLKTCERPAINRK